MRTGGVGGRTEGLTLVELVVALLIFSVGLLAVISLLALAASTAGEAARDAERARLVGQIHDSLALVGADQPGAREAMGDTVRWVPDEDGSGLQVILPAPGGRQRDTLRLPAFPGVPGSAPGGDGTGGSP